MANDSDYLRQAAALPVKGNKVCLVRSSNGKRWVIPKGLIDPGHTAGETALVEAWEEAGLAGTLQTEPIGSYLYQKLGGTYHVVVFLLKVTDAAAEWPEKEMRHRTWVSFERALEMIDDAGLRDLIESNAPTAA